MNRDDRIWTPFTVCLALIEECIASRGAFIPAAFMAVILILGILIERFALIPSLFAIFQ